MDLQLTRKIPDLPSEAVEPTVITGLDAIGRGQDLQNLQTFATVSQPAMQFIQGEINWSNYVLRVAQAAGVDPTGLLLSPEERQAQQQSQLQAQAMGAAAQSAGAAAGANMGAASTQDEQAMAAAAAQSMQ